MVKKGRKKLANNIIRRNKITVNLNDQQREDIEKMAIEAKSTISEYIRNRIFLQH